MRMNISVKKCGEIPYFFFFHIFADNLGKFFIDSILKQKIIDKKIYLKDILKE